MENGNFRFEIIDSKQLALNWKVPESWIRNRTRANCVSPIPHIKFGKYVRFEWGSKPLKDWFKLHRNESQCPIPKIALQPFKASIKPLPKLKLKYVVESK